MRTRYDEAVDALVCMTGEIYPDVTYADLRILCRGAVDEAWTKIRKSFDEKKS